MHQTFREQLIELWNGNIHHQREAVNYALDGSIRNLLLQFTIFPGYEHDWGLVQLMFKDAVVYLILIIILIVKPSGIFGKNT